MRRFLVLVVLAAAAGASVASAQGVPSPRPFPGAPAPPATAPRPAPVQQPQVTVAEPSTPAAGSPAVSGPDLPNVPVYPTAQYLGTVDAGMGQSYHLYGTDVPFSDIVAYYRTLLRNGGREIYSTPGTHQFDLGRFDDNRMAYPPSVVIKDYAGGPASGYLHIDGTTEARFQTVIQIVPPAGER